MPKLNPLGFHGDRYLLDTIGVIAGRVTHFIETGTGAGSTARYFAETYPGVGVRTCEVNAGVARAARTAFQHLPNVQGDIGDSREFLARVLPTRRRNEVGLFLLDAHGGWTPEGAFKPATAAAPLDEELALITTHRKTAVILIDDVPVSGRPAFRHSKYVNMGLIRRSLAGSRVYRFWSPDYGDRTSEFHPLTGYMFVTYGSGPLTTMMRSIPKIREV